MKAEISEYRNVESGSVVILGSGPSLNIYEGAEFACDIIGINLSFVMFPKQQYYTTVARDRLSDVDLGTIKADKAVFSCLHKANLVRNEIPQKILWVNMAMDDIYAKVARRKCIFTFDLEELVHKTFGGIFSIQIALFLGYRDIYLVGFDGGNDKFREGLKYIEHKGITPEYHAACMWHPYAWLKQHNEYFPEAPVNIYNCSPKSGIPWFPFREAPTK